MRLILPGLALLLLTACGLKDDLYLPDDTPPSPSKATIEAEGGEAVSEQNEDDAANS